MSREVVVVGAGGLARETMAAIGAHTLIGLVDDDRSLYGTLIAGQPVLGPVAAVASMDCDVVVCIGRGGMRRTVVRALDAVGVTEERYVSVVHPAVRVPDSCTVGPGSIILAGAVLTADVHVGRHVVVMPNAVLTHDDVVVDFATVCAGVVLGGGVRIGEGAYLGMNSSVRQGLSVGADAVLGMGSVALKDVPPNQTWAGVPAAPLRPRPFDLVPGGAR